MGFAVDQPVSSISVVRYGSDYGFLGFYIVHPEYRGAGIGMATWNAGIAYLKARTVGVDGGRSTGQLSRQWLCLCRATFGLLEFLNHSTRRAPER